MIHINAIQCLPESRAEVAKPSHLEISFDSHNTKEMTGSLLLLADSIPNIIKSITEPSQNENN